MFRFIPKTGYSIFQKSKDNLKDIISISEIATNDAKFIKVI